MEILVFKTNIEDKKHVRKLYPVLKNIQEISAWNVDLNDADKILRVEAVSLQPQSVEKILQSAGYYCEELED